jgi:hypothetical protein
MTELERLIEAMERTAERCGAEVIALEYSTPGALGSPTEITYTLVLPKQLADEVDPGDDEYAEYDGPRLSDLVQLTITEHGKIPWNDAGIAVVEQAVKDTLNRFTVTARNPIDVDHVKIEVPTGDNLQRSFGTPIILTPEQLQIRRDANFGFPGGMGAGRASSCTGRLLVDDPHAAVEVPIDVTKQAQWLVTADPRCTVHASVSPYAIALPEPECRGKLGCGTCAPCRRYKGEL